MKPAIKIIFWWDRQTRNWVTQAVDEDGSQAGEADYSPNQAGREVDCWLKALEHGVTKIEKK